MRVEEVCAKRYALVHRVDVGQVEGGRPHVVLVRKSHEQVSRAGAAVPHVMVVLPVLAEGGGEVVLRERHPLLRSEEGTLALAHVLRHEKVAAVDDVVPVFLPRRSLVAVPEDAVRLLSVGEGDFGKELEAEGVGAARLAVVVVHQEHVQLARDGSIVGREYVGKEEIGVEDAVLLCGGPVRHEDGGHHGLAPALVDVGEVVLGDLDGG